MEIEVLTKIYLTEFCGKFVKSMIIQEYITP
jgi:hypothetical protein